MANSYSTQDCVKGALQRCGENTDGSSQYHELALKYVNAANLVVLSGASEFAVDIGQPWTWARVEKYTILPGYYSTGSVAVAQGVASGTFSVAPTISLAGYYLNLTDNCNYYVILTHVAGSTSFTLASPVLEATGSAYAFQAIPLTLDLGPGILRLVEPFRIDALRCIAPGENYRNTGQIYGMGLDSFRNEFPMFNLVNDTPTKFAVLSDSESSLKVLFNRYVTNPIKITFDVIPIPDDLVDASTSIPVIPRNFRKVLEYAATAWLANDKKDATTAQNAFALVQSTLKAMLAEDKKRAKLISHNYAQLIPRQDDYNLPYWLSPQ